MFETPGPNCAERNSSLPVNDSGIRVLVYGLSKTGTKTIIRSLHDVGLDHSYHSEDLSLHIWSWHADRFWMRPENGGRRAGVSHGIYMFFGRHLDQLSLPYSNDTKVLDSLRREDFASSLAGCRVDSVAYDGMENLFWETYVVSPNAKVLVLDWRTATQWNNSRNAFGPMLLASCAGLGMLYAGVFAGPWILLLRPLDEFVSGDVRRLLLEGGPPLGTYNMGPIGTLHMATMGPRRIVTHLYAGLKLYLFTEKEYHGFYQAAYDLIPAKRRMSWNMKKHGYEELCAFLEIPAKDCPRKGRLRNQPTWWDWERDSVFTVGIAWALALAIHLVNWTVFRAGLTAFTSLFRLALRGRGGGGRAAVHVE